MKAPSFYDRNNAGTLFVPDLLKAQNEGADAGLKPASKSKRTKALVLVDMQVDFCIPSPVGKLSVGGAIEDTRRVVEELIFGDAENLTSVIASMDQHLPFQIFFGVWWIGADKKHPGPYTPITADDVESGKWRPLFDVDWSVDYVKKLGSIFIWPPHCNVGAPGASLMPSLDEAIQWLAAARKIQPIYMLKGSVPQTEHYGIFEPCVLYSKHPLGGRNTQMLDLVANHDDILVCGEAEDFCVKETMWQMLRYWDDNPDVLGKIRFVRNCTSLVFPDKRKEADKFLDEMAGKGIKIITTTEAVG